MKIRLGGDVSGFSSAMGQAVTIMSGSTAAMSQSLWHVGEALQRTGQNISLYLTAPLVAAGVIAARTAGDFEASMLRLGAISGATSAQLEQLRLKAEEMGAKTKFSASDAAEALNFMAMAGINANDSLRSLESVLTLAAASGLDMASSAEIATNILAGYRLGVEDLAHANDVLVFTMNATNTSLEGLAEALKYAGPIASAAGVSFEESAAILGLMGNAGIQASMAGTSLRGALARLITPTDQIKAAMQAAGLELRETADGGKDLLDFVRQLGPHVNDAGLMMTLFGQRAGPAFAAVVAQGADALEQLIIQNELAEGTAQRLADTYNQGLNGALSSLSSSIESISLAVGQAGMTKAITDAANALADFARSISTMNPEVLKAAAGFAAIVAAIGPLIVILGTIVRSFGALLGVLAGPVGVIALILGAVEGITIWRRLSAEIEGARIAMERTRDIQAELVGLMARFAAATGDARIELRQLTQARLDDLAAAAQAANVAAAEARAKANEQSGFFGGIGQALGISRQYEQEARTAEAAARAINEQLMDSVAAFADAEFAPELARRLDEAWTAFNADQAAAGGSFTREQRMEWYRANPQHADAMRRGGRQISAGASEIDALDMGGLGGVAGAVAPSVSRSQEIAALRAQAEAINATAEELQRLADIQTVYNDAANGGEAITMEEAAAHVDLRNELQNVIDTRAEQQAQLDAQISQQVAFDGQLQRTAQTQQLLTQAANEGAEAYEKMRIALDLIAQNPALSLEEALALAEGIRAQDRALADATSRMQRFSDLYRNIGDAMASAFERAIFSGESLRSTLGALMQDLAAMILRATVLQPLANSIAGALSGGKGGGGGFLSGIGSFFAGFFADGGFIPPGKWGITGERGPEPVFGGRTGATVVPANENGATYIDQRQYHFKGSAEELARFEGMVNRLDRSIEARAVGAFGELRRRGRA
ncbi:MAG: phage tail tape measure protein [Hyphomonadaceae bacterium]|nr:phage tail tape measure protein [Hyphomonadaceae bacterium]